MEAGVLLRARWRKSIRCSERSASVFDRRRKGNPHNDKLLSIARTVDTILQCFCHEDLAFGWGAEVRRFFFDHCAGMLWLDYIDLLRSIEEYST